jgi:hypothetical protein
LSSHAIVEAFGDDLELARDVPEGAGREDRVPFPTMRFEGEDGTVRWRFGRVPWEHIESAMESCGVVPAPVERPGVRDALARWGSMAEREIEAVCGLPGPRAAAELWRLASEWQVKPVRVLTGWMWEPA